MDKSKIISFFNQLAPKWDEENDIDEEKLCKILEFADIKKGCNVLDVACGTGVLFPYYLKRKVNSIGGVEISYEMIQIAKSKVIDPCITLINEDIMDCVIDREFDRCIVFNAFPHFPEPKELISCLANKITTSGRLTVAHSMSRKKLDEHHSTIASSVSTRLISESELSALFAPYFNVDTAISNDDFYIVSGCRY